MKVDLTVCRICLQSSDEEMSSIFEEDNNNITISMKIESCAGIKITSNSEFPTNICKKCNAFLSIAHKFRTICRNSDDYLHEFVAKSERNDYDEVLELVEDIKPITKLSVKPYLLSDIQECTLDSPKNISDREDRDSSDESCSEENDNGVYSDNSNVDTKDDLVPLKTLGMSEDGSAIIETARKQTIHICEVCGNTYERRYSLEAHMRRHRGEKPFECEICKKGFALNFQLTRHMRSHTGQRPYKCKFCDRTFADRSTNVKHERIHTNERPYKCDTCGKSFTYSNVLKVHIMTHTGEKPFTCELCGKRFSQLHHLRAHLQTLQHQNDPNLSRLLLKSEPLTVV